MKSCIAALVLAVTAGATAGCFSESDDAPGARVAVQVAPLTLPGVSNARFLLEVRNGLGALVVSKELTSSAYGAGDGSVSYVAPCDADPLAADNTVSITLLAVYAGASGQALIDPASYQNPGEVTRHATCLANADVAVTFDLTLVRQANQGFFDIAVSFTDIFCSAKLDCVGQDGAPIKLLFNAAGQRATTIVSALACTGGVTGGATVLYRDPVVLDCGADGVATVNPVGDGNLSYGAGITGDPVLFGAAVTRGDELLGFTKRYWNVMLGLVDETAGCRLTTRATASRGPFTPANTTPAGTTYPFIHWDVPVTDGAGALICAHHPVNGQGAAAGVATAYTDGDTARSFANSWAGAATLPETPPASGVADCAGWDYCWKYDEATGSTAADDGAQGADGTLVQAAWATGHTAGGLQLNGTSAYVNAVDGVFNVARADLTAVAWLKWGGLNGDDWSVVVSTSSGWEFGISAAQQLTYYDVSRHAVVTCPFSVATYAGVWTQVAATVSGSHGRARLFINGVKCNEVAYSGSIPASTGAVQAGVWLGGAPSEQEHLLGTLDELRVGAFELGEADLLALYAAESGGTPATAPALASCLALFNAGYGTDGVFAIDPDGAGPLASRDVVCDMANGGWTLAGRQASSGAMYLGGQAVNLPGDATFSSNLTGVPFTAVKVFNESNAEAFTQTFAASTWTGVTSGQQQVGTSAPAFRQGTYGGSLMMGCVNYSQANMNNGWACDNDSTKGQRGHITDYAGEFCSGGRLDGTWAWTNGSTCALRGQAYVWGIAIR